MDASGRSVLDIRAVLLERIETLIEAIQQGVGTILPEDQASFMSLSRRKADLVKLRREVTDWEVGQTPSTASLRDRLAPWPDLLAVVAEPATAAVLAPPAPVVAAMASDDPLLALQSRSGDETVRALPLVKRLIASTPDLKGPWSRAVDCLEALEEGRYADALVAAVPLRLAADSPFLIDLSSTAVRLASRWVGEELERLVARARAVTSSAAEMGAPAASELHDLEARGVALDDCVRALEQVEPLPANLQAELSDLRLLLSRLPALIALHELRERATEAVRNWGLHTNELRDLYEEISLFPHHNLPGYDQVNQLGQQLRKLDAEYRQESGVIRSIVRSTEILEKIRRLEDLNRRSTTVWDGMKHVPIEDELERANGAAAEEAIFQVERRRKEAAPFYEGDPARALQSLEQATDLEVVAKCLPPADRQALAQEMDRLATASDAWQRAQALIDESARSLNLAERIRLLGRAADTYPYHPALAERLKAAWGEWWRDTSRAVTECLNDIAWRLPTSELGDLASLRESLAGADQRLHEFADRADSGVDAASLLARLGEARGQIEQREHELAMAEMLLGQIEESLAKGKSQVADGLMSELDPISMPSGLAARAARVRVELASQRGIDRLLEEGRRALAAGRPQEALDAAERLTAIAPGSTDFRDFLADAYLAYHLAEADKYLRAEEYEKELREYELLTQSGVVPRDRLPAKVADRLKQITAMMEQEAKARTALDVAATLCAARRWDSALQTLHLWQGQQGPWRREVSQRIAESASALESDLRLRGLRALDGAEPGEDLGLLVRDIEEGLGALNLVNERSSALGLLARRVRCADGLRALGALRRRNLDAALTAAKVQLEEYGDLASTPEYDAIEQMYQQILLEKLLARIQLMKPADAVESVRREQSVTVSLRDCDGLNLRLAELLLQLERWDDCEAILATVSAAGAEKARDLKTQVHLSRLLQQIRERFEKELAQGRAYEAYREAVRDLYADPIWRSHGPEAAEQVPSLRLQTIGALLKARPAPPAGGDRIRREMEDFIVSCRILELYGEDPEAVGMAFPDIRQLVETASARRDRVRASLNRFLSGMDLDVSQVGLAALDGKIKELHEGFHLADQIVVLLRKEFPAGNPGVERIGRTCEQLERIRNGRDQLMQAVRQAAANPGTVGAVRPTVDSVRGILNAIFSQPLAALAARVEEYLSNLDAVGRCYADLVNTLDLAEDERSLQGTISRYKDSRRAAQDLRRTIREAERQVRNLPPLDDQPFPKVTPDTIVLPDSIFGTVEGLGNIDDLLESREGNLLAVQRWEGELYADLPGLLEDAPALVADIKNRERSLRLLSKQANALRADLEAKLEQLAAFPFDEGVSFAWMRRLADERTGGELPCISTAARASYERAQRESRAVRREVDRLEVVRGVLEKDLPRVRELEDAFWLLFNQKRPVQPTLLELRTLDPRNENLPTYHALAGLPWEG